MQLITTPTPMSTEVIDDRVATVLEAGTNITLTYDDAANVLTIDATPGGSGYTDEQAQDAVGNILQDSATIDYVYNDATPYITGLVKDNSITEAMLSFSDNTTKDSTVSVHGLLPKLSGNTTTFLRGDGTWIVPPTGTSYTDEQAQDTVAAMLIAGANITLSYNDVANTLTITAAGGTSYTNEDAQDAVGGILTDTTTIDFTYNDATPSIVADVKDASITEAKMSLSDITTHNVSTTRHGLTPKAPNNAAQYLDGTGAWSTPAGDGSGAPTDGARVRRTTAQAITQNILTSISYDTEDLDQSAYFTSGNPTRITVPRTGWYVIAAQVAWASNSGGFRDINFRVNGTDFRAVDRVPGSVQTITQLATSVIYLTIADYVEIVVYQTTTGALNVTESIATISYLGTGATGAGPTTEEIQDIVGGMLLDSATVDFTYDDTAGTITAVASTPYSTFVALTDTPDYAGNALKILRANAAENALEYGPVLGTMATQHANAVAITGGSAQFDALTSRAGIQALQGISVPDYNVDNAVAYYSTQAATGAADKWFVYGAGTAPSYFGGTVQVNGHTGVGVAPAADSTLNLTWAKATQQAIKMRPTDSDTGYGPLTFQNLAGTAVGTITTTASATAYNTSSDIRLKHNIQPLTNVLDCIRALRPISHLWNADGSYGEGFLAHELQQQIPLAVTGEPNEVNEDGSIRPQQVDHGKLVPRLTAGLQEALNLIESLTARVAALEAQLA